MIFRDSWSLRSDRTPANAAMPRAPASRCAWRPWRWPPG